MNCTCAVADSFNVRVADLIDPKCPEHGCKLNHCPLRQSMLGADMATDAELESLLRESLEEIHPMPGRFMLVVKSGNTIEMTRNLLNRYEIRRRR